MNVAEDSFLQYTYPSVLVLVRVRVLAGIFLNLILNFGAGVLSNPRFLPRQALVVNDGLATKDEPCDLSW